MKRDKKNGVIRRQPLQHELTYIESMTKLLSAESGIPADWIKDVLIRTLPNELSTGVIDSSSAPGQALYLFKPCLLEAMKWLPKDQVVELFSGDLLQLSILEDRFNSLIDEVPFVNFKELLPTAKEFQAYLEDEFKSIIDTGSPSKHFKKSYYLETTFLQSVRPRILSLEETPESVYLERHKQFTERTLSDSSLKKILGPNYYLEFREVQNSPYVLGPNFKTVFGELMDGFYKETATDRSAPSDSLFKLRQYLSSNKLKIPANIEKRDEALRTSLYIFAQDALKAFIKSHRNHELGTTLKKVWELICSMPYEQLDLIFNGNMSYLGITEYDIDDPSLYTYGRSLIERILIAAALEDESIRLDFRSKIQEYIGPVIEDFSDAQTGEIHPITYSVYQAIDLCGHDSVTSACGEFATAKMKLTDLHASLKKGTQRALKISFDRLKEIRREVAQIEFLRAARASEVEGGIPVGDGNERPILERGFFTQDYGEYLSKNPAYPPFQFNSEIKRNAIARLHRAYETAYPDVLKQDLIDAIYGDRANEKDRRKNPWKLEDILKRDDAMKYGMVRRGKMRNGSSTYTLDFSFEDYSPEEQLHRIKRQKEEKENSKTETKAEKTKLKSESKKSPHAWGKSLSGKLKRKTRKESRPSKADQYPDDDND